MRILGLCQKHQAKVLVTALTIALLFTACNQKEEKQYLQQSAEEKQEYEKAPQKLTSIEENIEKIIKALEGPAVMMKDEKKEEDSQQEEQQQGQQQETTQKQEESQDSSEKDASGSDHKSESSEKSNENQMSQQQQAPQKPQKDPWKEIDGIISNLHYQWNDYMPDVVKKGADPRITSNFSNALNTLTNTVRTKDKVKTLKDANALYGCVFELYTLYRTKMSPEIKRMRYLIRNTILDSMTGTWDQADRDSASIKSSWSILKNTMGKDQQEDTSKLDFSIIELERVISQRNASLTDIKGRVALSNIQAIEKSYEKESS